MSTNEGIPMDVLYAMAYDLVPGVRTPETVQMLLVPAIRPWREGKRNADLEDALRDIVGLLPETDAGDF